MAKKDAPKNARRAPKEDAPVPSSPSSKGKPVVEGGGDGFSAGEFATGTREELTKVIWPTRQQLISESAAVILMVGLSATLIYLIDKLFGWASRLVF